MRTVGVEEELLLVDPETGEPQALSAAVLARASRCEAEKDVFEKELHNQMLEFNTHPQSGMGELAAEIVRIRGRRPGTRGRPGARSRRSPRPRCRCARPSA